MKHGRTRLRRGAETGAIKQFAFAGGEEAFAHGMIKAIAGPAHREADASFAATVTNGNGCVLATVIGMMDDILGTALLNVHL